MIRIMLRRLTRPAHCSWILTSWTGSKALKQLTDVELDKLLAAALAEQQRRGRKASSNKRQGELMRNTLTPSKINAVRAAFKAGVKPSQIARQFGISRTDVQKALTGD
jgi:predicted DNA binding protein